MPRFSKDEVLRDVVFGFMGKQSPSAGGRSATIFLIELRAISFAVREDFPVLEIVGDRISVR